MKKLIPALLTLIVVFVAVFGIGAWLNGVELGDPIALPFALPGLGDSVAPLLAVASFTALFLGLILGMGIVIRFLFPLLDKLIVGTTSADGYTQRRAALNKQESDQIKQWSKERPGGGVPNHDRYRWAAISTALTSALLGGYLGVAINENFMHGENQFFWGVVFGIVTALLVYLTMRPRQVQYVNSQDTNVMDWGNLWVVLTGLIVLGIGLGVMMFVRSSGG